MTSSSSRSSDFARAAIEEYRRKLLDLGGRNRFLNFAHRETARAQLRLVNNSPQALFDLLESEHDIAFTGLRKPADLEPLALLSSDDGDEPDEVPRRRTRAYDSAAITSCALSQGVDPSYDLPIDVQKTAHARLQTLLFEDQLKVRLQTIYDEAKRFIQEMGINTLNCAIGFVEWYESDSSERARFAPLLIVPIEMQRTLINANYNFSVRGMGEDAQSNPSLIERVSADFGIRLPTYEPEQTLTEFFNSIEFAISGRKRWKVRRMATISLLNFAKLALYRDLDATRRPSHAQLESNPVVMDLICGIESAASASMDAEENVDHPSIAARVPLLVTEADASQFAAVADAMTGKSMVIEGPPGTGKSQTITNIIAAALAKGERVLFVAEKLAALDVVKSKLDKYGLGAFCLELHSTKARKSDVHESLKRRLNRNREREPDLAQIVTDLNQQKGVIQEYLDSLHAVYGRLGVPLHDLLWREQRMRSELGADAALLEDVFVPGARDFDEAGISAVAHRLGGYESMFSDVCTSYGSIQRHPWFGVKSSDLKLDERQALLGRLRRYHSVFDELCTFAVAPLRSIGFAGAITLGDALSFAALAASIEGPGPQLPPATLLALQSGSGLEIAERFVRNVLARKNIREAYAADSLAEIVRMSGEVVSCLAALTGTPDDETPLFALRERAQSVNAEVDELERDRTHLSAVVTMLGAISAEDISSAMQLSELLRSTPRRILTQRRPGLLEETVAFDIRAACMAGQQLMSERSALELRFDLRDLPDVRALRDQARLLRDAGMFWFFNDGVRNARKTYRRHSLRQGNATNAEMAAGLTELDDHVERALAFETSSRYASLFEGLFEGLNTDFGFIESMVDFGEAVRSVCRAAYSRARMQAIAIARPVEEIDAFVRLMDEPRTQRIVGSSAADWEADLLQRIAVLNERKLQLLLLESKTTGLGVHRGLRVFELRELLNASIQYRDLTLRIDGDGAAKKLLEAAFSKLAEDCAPLEKAIRYYAHINSATIPAGIRKALRSASPEARDTLMSIIGEFWKSSSDRIGRECELFASEPHLDAMEFFGSASAYQCNLPSINARLSEALGAADSLEEWLRFQAGRQRAFEVGGPQLIGIFETKLLTPSTALSSAFEYCAIRTVVRMAIDDHPNLRGLAGVTLNEARRRFQELDVRLLELSRMQLGARLDRVVVDPGNGVGRKSAFTGKALIMLEVQKMKRHVAIRDLVQRSGLALQQLKPCFMMSPLSVAQYIPPGSIEFDLVVIDEASQMRPEDSLAALSRGKRAVVVGDQKQLPPTSFFERLVDDEDVPDEDAVDNESVLDLALGQYGHSRRLRWHYRSRHESLIAFSNRYFYDDDLIVLPSPHSARGELGVRSTFVESTYSKGRNIGEAEAIVEAVMRFMRTTMAHSVGVVAVNKDQKELIQELLDRAIAEDEAAQRYIAAWDGTLHPYFVKNLESVQGDERDVMFISTVYGPETVGGRVAQRFGPILGAAGWRRLNVLFTRARVRVELFTSMRPSDIRTEEGRSSRGLVAFRNYLDYAQTGRLESGKVSSRPPDSDFEIAVGRMLEAHGYEVVPQVGVEKYYIDMAVRHPKNGGFLLGIECDGASYHSSRSARDRDRTREEALQGLGWTLYRIWSTDWFANPTREFEKLDRHLKQILTTADSA